MKYQFKCECGNVKEVECPMQDISTLKVKCDKCGVDMKRMWNTSFVIPEYMKNENTQEMSYVTNILKTRPSGKNKVWY